MFFNFCFLSFLYVFYVVLSRDTTEIKQIKVLNLSFFYSFLVFYFLGARTAEMNRPLFGSLRFCHLLLNQPPPAPPPPWPPLNQTPPQPTSSSTFSSTSLLLHLLLLGPRQPNSSSTNLLLHLLLNQPPPPPPPQPASSCTSSSTNPPGLLPCVWRTKQSWNFGKR